MAHRETLVTASSLLFGKLDPHFDRKCGYDDFHGSEDGYGYGSLCISDIDGAGYGYEYGVCTTRGSGYGEQDTLWYLQE